jgi:uncharacterized delta-60 repeat protein
MKKLILWLLLALPILIHAQPVFLDPGFGNNGAAISQQTGWGKDAYDLIRQPDGKLIAAGIAYERYGQFNYQSLIARFLPNGKIDSSFGTNGSVRFNLDGKNAVAAIALQQDGKIVIACNESIIIQFGNPPSAQLLSRPFIARLNPNGTFDNSFGTNGIHRLELLDTYTDKELAAITVLSNGKIIAGGTIIGSGINMMLICLNPDGSYSNNFGVSGIAQYTAGSDKYTALSHMAVQADGKIVMSGVAQNTGPVMPDAKLFALGRANADGTADVSFGTQGMVVTQISQGVQFIEDIAMKVILQPDGKICLAGAAGNKLALARYLTNGSPDPAFGLNGTVVHAQHPAATGLGFYNGKLYTCGSVYQSDNTLDISISAFNTDGSADNTFAVDGMHTTNIYHSNYAHSFLIQPDGKLVVGGAFGDENDQQGILLARFRTGGGTGINPEKDNQADLVLYPNPAGDLLTLSFSNAAVIPRGNIYIRSTSGQVVYTGELKGRQTTIPVNHLASGIYALRVTIGQDVQTLKFVKK